MVNEIEEELDLVSDEAAVKLDENLVVRVAIEGVCGLFGVLLVDITCHLQFLDVT